ncbi:hypothetical protein [Marisediminicola sp. LYQ134]|uniref:hypothetical protein n=1 Tax=unclassified Marisediminicola TaxID=2618316 RepID=UPI003983AADC
MTPDTGVAPAVAVASLRSAILADGATDARDARGPKDAAARVAAVTADLCIRDLHAVFLAARADALRRHLSLGIPHHVTDATLADIPSKITAYGTSVDRPWLVGLMRADVLGIGRLQFERVAADEGRGIHIPEGGPLTPADVDASLAAARDLLGHAPLVCTSWVFDPTLRALPPTSNIRGFVGRFDVDDAVASESADHSVARFVFRRPLADVLDPTSVTPATRVERIVAEHLRGGLHWSEPRATLRQ